MDKVECTVISPTFIVDEAVNEYSRIDSVERGGYIPNDKKIESFLQAGVVKFEQRRGVGEYEIQEEESDFEPDSPEYMDELTQQAESFDEEPLSQYMDKITAVEILNNGEKTIESRKKEAEKNKNKKADSFEDSVVKAITKGFDEVKDKKTSSAGSQPKE